LLGQPTNNWFFCSYKLQKNWYEVYIANNSAEVATRWWLARTCSNTEFSFSVPTSQRWHGCFSLTWLIALL